MKKVNQGLNNANNNQKSKANYYDGLFTVTALLLVIGIRYFYDEISKNYFLFYLLSFTLGIFLLLSGIYAYVAGNRHIGPLGGWVVAIIFGIIFIFGSLYELIQILIK